MFPGGEDGRCVGLTTLPLSCADCLEIWEPQPPGTLIACTGIALPFTSYIKILKVTQKRLIIFADGFSFLGPSSYCSPSICTGGYKSAFCHKSPARSQQGSAELRLCFRLFSCRFLSLCWTSVFSVGGASACLYGRKITRPSLVALMWPSHFMIIWNYIEGAPKVSSFDRFTTQAFVRICQQREDVTPRLGSSCEHVEPSCYGWSSGRRSGMGSV
jgi:hypothetical protein